MSIPVQLCKLEGLGLLSPLAAPLPHHGMNHFHYHKVLNCCCYSLQCKRIRVCTVGLYITVCCHVMLYCQTYVSMVVSLDVMLCILMCVSVGLPLDVMPCSLTCVSMVVPLDVMSCSLTYILLSVLLEDNFLCLFQSDLPYYFIFLALFGYRRPDFGLTDLL